MSMQTIAAVVRSAASGFNTEEVEVDDPRDREVLVRVRASGLCHSDLTLSRIGEPYSLPSVFGHEIAGTVAQVGSEVTEFQAGDHVVATLIRFCGRCVTCLSGATHFCTYGDETLRNPGESPRLRSAGSPLGQAYGVGGFAGLALVHENQLAKVDPELPFAQAAVIGCSVLTGAGAVLNTAQVRRGASVVVIGAGGVGLNSIGAARIAGADTIIAVDVNHDKLRQAEKFGATAVIHSGVQDPVAALRKLLPGGSDYVFDFVGTKSTVQQACGMLAYAGGLYLVGIAGPSELLELDAWRFITNRNRLESVYMGSANLKRDIPFYARLALDGLLNLQDLVSEEIAISDVQRGFERLRDGSVARVVITDFDH